MPPEYGIVEISGREATVADKHRNIANPAMAQAMRELRRSSAASPHADRRERKARTRAASLRRDLKDAA